MFEQISQDLQKYINPAKAAFFPSFFKTGKKGYAEGDKFIGVIVPHQRLVAKKYISAPLSDIKKLLESEIHVYRLTGLFILVYKFEKASPEEKKAIYEFYTKNRAHVNNWDLVDTSAPHIVGTYLLDKDRIILYGFARSSDLWERRIAIVATQAFIRKNDFTDTIKIAEILLHDTHDLIHKAVGWMLREVGKRDRTTEEAFLKKYHKIMPRTMLRYSLEHFDEGKKKIYMAK
jgi:3-methyladenine DNA glycosylase AlkD